MDVVLLIIAIICLLIGFAGCILPVLPGPPISYVGLLLLHWTKYTQFSPTLLIVLAVLVVAVTIADNIFPVWMTKKQGGSKWGIWGATVGMLLGFFFGPWGVILFPFFGALAGELLAGNNQKRAMRAALGSFLGFFLGIGAKLITCGVIAFYFIQSLF